MVFEKRTALDSYSRSLVALRNPFAHGSYALKFPSRDFQILGQKRVVCAPCLHPSSLTTAPDSVSAGELFSSFAVHLSEIHG